MRGEVGLGSFAQTQHMTLVHGSTPVGGASMETNEVSLQYKKNGPALILEILVERVVADWSVRHIVGQNTKQLWQGRTDDLNADVAAVNVVTLTEGSQLNWSLLLYGPRAAMSVPVAIAVRQAGELLGSKSIGVSLSAKKAMQESGSFLLTAK